MSDLFNPKKIMQRVVETAARERKVIGGSYEATFRFSGIAEFLVFTAAGVVQAKGEDAYHVYVKPWGKSYFREWTPEQVLEKYSASVQTIEVRGCGGPYLKQFQGYDPFLNWLGFPRQLDLLAPIK